jgi:hypothetical protein
MASTLQACVHLDLNLLGPISGLHKTSHLKGTECWYFARSNGYGLFVMVSLLITTCVSELLPRIKRISY